MVLVDDLSPVQPQRTMKSSQYNFYFQLQNEVKIVTDHCLLFYIDYVCYVTLELPQLPPGNHFYNTCEEGSLSSRKILLDGIYHKLNTGEEAVVVSNGQILWEDVVVLRQAASP